MLLSIPLWFFMIPILLGLVFIVPHFWDLFYGEEEDNKYYGDAEGNDKNDPDSEATSLFDVGRAHQQSLENSRDYRLLELYNNHKMIEKIAGSRIPFEEILPRESRSRLKEILNSTEPQESILPENELIEFYDDTEIADFVKKEELDGDLTELIPINPIELPGLWRAGLALDFHTLSSEPVKDDLGNVIYWNTERSSIGEKLYRLKYKEDKSKSECIAKTAAYYLHTQGWNIDVLIPVPPSSMNRSFQPVEIIASQIENFSNTIKVDLESVKKVKSTSQLKKVEDSITRKNLLEDAFNVNSAALNGKSVLLFDDLYRSGETLTAITNAIKASASVNSVYVLTITKTRTNR